MSHHLDSPLARQDIRLDITDLYLFRGEIGTVFVIVEAFIRTLGRIIVPIVNVPLSAVLVAQGCVLLFLGALYLLARHGREM